MNLHKLRIYAPDGIGATATVMLDGEQIFPTAITLRYGGEKNTISAAIEFKVTAVEFDGYAEVAV